MAKKIVDFEKDLGSDGAKIGGALSVVVDQLEAKIAITYPVAKVLEPAFAVGDKLVDKIEQLIPGDQTSLAAGLKEDFRRELTKLFTEQLDPVIVAHGEQA